MHNTKSEPLCNMLINKNVSILVHINHRKCTIPIKDVNNGTNYVCFSERIYRRSSMQFSINFSVKLKLL